MYESWRQFYDDVVSRYPDVLKHRKIVLKWMSEASAYNRMLNNEPIIYQEYSIYLDTLKKKCFEESLEKV